MSEETNKNGLLRFICTVEYVLYYKDQFGIASCSVDEVKEGKFKNPKEYITIKGQMAEPKVGYGYYVTAEEVEDPKYGTQYKIQSMCSSTIFDINDKVGQKKFLRAIFTERQVENMYAALPDPFKTLEEKDFKSLVHVNGCRIKTAVRWCNVFDENYSIGKILTELSDYSLTNHMARKLVERYNSPDLVIEKVKNNPYILCTEVDGIGWKTADKLAQDGGMHPHSKERIKAFIRMYLDTVANEGCSWIDPDELMGAILDNLGDDVPDAPITEAIRDLGNRLWWNEDKTKIGLKKYYTIENQIAEELLRIRDAENEFEFSEWQDVVKRLEGVQGWEYTDEQKKGIQTALENNVVVIHGYAGTGKSTLVSALVNILKDYSYVQCALAGRAAARMAEITGTEGYTIHRLLGYPLGAPEKGCFAYHDENQMPYQIYIVDEISMIGAPLFLSLVKAIPSGAKLICLGDTGQLESIECGNVAHDMINSGEIAVVGLSRIHRQAAKSAIITESIRVRQGTQIIPKEWVGEEVRGELQDLKLECFSDASNTYYRVMKAFATAMNHPGFSIMETQVIVPVKNRGGACTITLNNAIQEIYNPPSPEKEEVYLTANGKTYCLRVGDKVMNTKNNTKIKPAIFNGNLGILKSFEIDDDGEEYMVIDFLGIGEVRVPRKFWNSIELGYAITVHKFQGSQADHIIFGLDFSSYHLLTRELLYTAITRAKKYTELIAQTNALRMATVQEQVSKKQTHLQDLLYERAHPKLIF